MLDTGSSSIVVRRTELREDADKYIRYGPLWDIRDANNKPLPIIDTFKLLVQLRAFFVLVGFIVYQSLGTPCLVQNFLIPLSRLFALIGSSSSYKMNRKPRMCGYL